MCAAKEYVKKNGFNIKAIVSLIVISSFVVTCFMAIAFFIFNAKGANQRSRDNKKDIEILRSDTAGMKSDIKNINETTKTILQHVLRKK